MNTASTILVLDAMGVLYQSGDDVAELLIPFVQKHNVHASVSAIEEAYLEASLGHIDNTAFWQKLNLDPALEDDYLSCHVLTEGVAEFLSLAATKFATICCLSNDVTAWSLKLRNRFSLTHWIKHWIISGDAGYRKPSPQIYSILLDSIGAAASNVLFVDDREKNLHAARLMGFSTALFDPKGMNATSTHKTISQLSGLLR